MATPPLLLPGPPRYWWPAFAIALLLLWLTGLISIAGATAATTLALLGLAYHRSTHPALHMLNLLLVAILALGLATHSVPGFNNPVLIDDTVLSPGAPPFQLYLNLDTAIAAAVLLGFLVPRSAEPLAFARTTSIVLATSLLIAAVIFPLAMLTHTVAWAPKLPSWWPLWAATNLLITCVAEEAFFRGLLQARLAQWLEPRFRQGGSAAVLLTAALFGAAHSGAGPWFATFAGLAGAGYGWVYARTRRLVAAIATHFLVNVIHFMFFSFPRLSAGHPEQAII